MKQQLILRSASAWFMIMLYGIMMLHHALPHVHHDHERLNDQANADLLHQDHDHLHVHFHQEHKQGSIWIDLLTAFLEHHSHSFESQELKTVADTELDHPQPEKFISADFLCFVSVPEIRLTEKVVYGHDDHSPPDSKGTSNEFNRRGPPSQLIG